MLKDGNMTEDDLAVIYYIDCQINDLGIFIPANLYSPKFDEAGRIHDWRNYISYSARRTWSSFTDRERMLLFIEAQKRADLEEWN